MFPLTKSYMYPSSAIALMSNDNEERNQGMDCRYSLRKIRRIKAEGKINVRSRTGYKRVTTSAARSRFTKKFSDDSKTKTL
jgi:hypothetical protein